MEKRAVVLYSGGIDSTTSLAIAKAEGYSIYALSIDYGQKHRIELDCARMNAQMFAVHKHLLISFDLRAIGGSSLTSERETPRKTHDPDSLMLRGSAGIPNTYVPARNTIFLSFALAWAETLDATDIFTGVNAIDYSGYPDCRPEFIEAFEKMANLATRASVEDKIKFRIRAPLIALTKADIIRKGIELNLDYSHTWSCYDPLVKSEKAFADKKRLYKACGKCDSCILRARGFREAGFPDPLSELQI